MQSQIHQQPRNFPQNSSSTNESPQSSFLSSISNISPSKTRSLSGSSNYSCYQSIFNSLFTQSSLQPCVSHHNTLSSSRKLAKNVSLDKLSKTSSKHSQTILAEGIFPKLKSKLLSNSNIIRTQQDAQGLLEFFTFEIKDIKLLHRASQHKFRLKKYFQKCGTQTDTIIVCLTTKDKIIGAFSPASHSWTGKVKKQQYHGEWVPDAKRQSFIFSLTDNQKFILKDQSRALWRRNDDCWINFGDDQLRIGDRSNIKDNLSVINENYKCGYYPIRTINELKMSCESFNGSKEPLFRTKEWEVWKVGRSEVDK